MDKTPRTYKENGAYYAILTLKNGHIFYVSGFKTRGAAFRYAVKHSEV